MKYHNYIFLTGRKNLLDISSSKRETLQKEFLREIEGGKEVVIYSYTIVGLKSHISLLLWMQSDTVIAIQDVVNKLMHSDFGKYLRITYTLFGMLQPTQYSPGAHAHLQTTRKGGQYLIIYPFTKTKEWYMLDFEKRKELMQGHMAIGRKYPQITQLLLYSYGVDDCEFIVSYETDDLSDFQRLVMELRSDKVRIYTERDTPIFTCVYRSLQEALTFL